MTSKAPKFVGVWIIACSPQGDLIKWGQDGDVKYPLRSSEEAQGEAAYLSGFDDHKGYRFYLLHVFDNGQMVTEEVP